MSMFKVSQTYLLKLVTINPNLKNLCKTNMATFAGDKVDMLTHTKPHKAEED